MPRNRHWKIFADDTGDPGPEGSHHFGYSALALQRFNVRHLTQIVAEYRVKFGVFHETKGSMGNALFEHVIAELATACEAGTIQVGAAILRKDKYHGPWLHETAERSGDPHFLRNFCLRHALEVLFADVEFDEKDTIELVVDRVDYSDRQTRNLQRYLASKYTNEGRFSFPMPRHIIHADSLYVDGLQVAHHLAELAHLTHDLEHVGVAPIASRFLRIKTLVRSREFTMDAEAAKGMGRKTLRESSTR